MTAAPNLNARLGAVIRKRRVQLGLTQLTLAARMGLTFQQIQKYEKGTNQVGFPRLVELAKALDTSVADLTAAAMGEEAARPEGLSERETLELLKRLAVLTPNQRRGVQLLVHNLAGGE